MNSYNKLFISFNYYFLSIGMAMPTYLKNLITYTQDPKAAAELGAVGREANVEVHVVRAGSAVLRRRPEQAGSW